MLTRFTFNLGLLSILLFISFIFVSAEAMAQLVPSGSYKDSCRTIQVVGGTLIAQCQKIDGSWQNSTLQYGMCDGDIRNDNGKLRCKQRAGTKTSKSAPKGSYKKSCKNYYTEGKRLYATCEKKNGGWRSSSINYKNCNKDIWNDNGNLTCGNRNSSGKLPKGSYKNSCRNIYVEGNLLEAECLNRNGKYSHTSINYRKCNKGVYNDKGRLRCN